tara:strand:+ start:514 stop:738 length:225 start_codon:yes stop_codon:yes gene_type:complete
VKPWADNTETLPNRVLILSACGVVSHPYSHLRIIGISIGRLMNSLTFSSNMKLDLQVEKMPRPIENECLVMFKI